MTLGTLVTLPMSGFIASDLGWQYVFYIEGGLAIIWYFLWLLLVHDSPSEHPRISPKEKIFIQESIAEASGSAGLGLLNTNKVRL